MMSKDRIESRTLEISDFRNLGITDPSVESRGKAVLKLNRSLKKENLGGLVIILGSNNSGKTNVISALEKVRRKEFREEDYTDFVKVRQNPHLEFSVAGGRYGDISSPEIVRGQERCTMQGRFRAILLYLLRQKESYALYREYLSSEGRSADIEEYMNNGDAFARGEECTDESRAYAYILRNRGDIQCGYLGILIDGLESGQYRTIRDREVILSAKGTELDEVELIDENYGKLGALAGIRPRYVRKDRVDEYFRSQKGFKSVFKKTASFIKTGKKNDTDSDLKIIDFAGGMKETQVVRDAFSETYGYNLSSNVYRYNRRKICDRDFETGVNIHEGFIPDLFASLGYSPQNILSEVYLSSADVVEKLERSINSELQTISETFNRLLNFNGRPYSMSIRIGDRKIAFSLKCGDTKLRIDHQSEGFRWVFEFFFSFLLSNKFVTGDIIVVDEFGGLLNPGTVRELTSTLRAFGKENGVTFVLATQNPMAVDIAHLDEVRIVCPRRDGPAVILNDFTEFYSGNTDVLEHVTGCLTVGRDYLRRMRAPTLFVETPLEYFVLTVYCRKTGTDMDIIPVDGCLDEGIVASQLLSMERRPVLLSHRQEMDDGFTDRMEKIGITAVSVRDMEYADIFAPLAENEQYCLPRHTDFDSAYSIGSAIGSADLSDESMANIRQLLDYLSM